MNLNFYKSVFLVSVFSLLSSASFAALSGNYTIDGNSPATATNYTTFASAVSDLSYGVRFDGGPANGALVGGMRVTGPVVFSVLNGPYNERIVIYNIPGASAVNTITFQGNGNTLAYPGYSAERAAITLDGASWITFDGLVINVTGGTHGWGVHLWHNADNNTISNCTVMCPIDAYPDNNYAGIVAVASATSISTTLADNANNTTINGNTIIGGKHGIYMVGNGDLDMATGNVITDNIIQDMGLEGIYIRSQDGAVVKGNDISRPNRVNSQDAVFTGIELSGGTNVANKNNIIEANRIHDPYTAMTGLSINLGTHGINVINTDAPAGEENLVINNLIYNITGPMFQRGIRTTGSNGVHIFHNTVVLDDSLNTSAEESSGIQVTGAGSNLATNIEVKNNVVVLTRTGSGSGVALDYSFSQNDVASDHNVVFLNTALSNLKTAAWGDTLYATLSEWQTADGGAFDAHSVFADPQFLDPANENYITTNPLVDGAAMATNDVGVVNDINGNSRSANPDPGAFESCSAPDAGFTYTQNGQQFTFTSTSGNALVYEWSFGEAGGSSMEEDPVYTYSAPGVYSVRLIVGNECGRDTFIQEVSVITGIEATSDNSGVSLYPNPSTGITTLEFDEALHTTTHITIQDANGRVMEKTQVAKGCESVVLPIDALADGCYFVNIHQAVGVVTLPFILNRR